MFRDSFEVKGTTPEEAALLGMEYLGATRRDEVEIEILDEGRVGGQFSWETRPARVRVTRRVEGFGRVSREWADGLPADPSVEHEPVLSRPSAAESAGDGARVAVEEDTAPTETGVRDDTEHETRELTRAEESIPEEAPRGRRRRSRSRTRVMPKPNIVIGDSQAPAESLSTAGLEPSRARPRPEYEPTEADNTAFEEVTLEFLESMDLPHEVEFESGDYQRAFVEVPRKLAGVLIGRRGATIDAFEYLLGRLVSQRVGHLVPVQVDVNQYRSGREQELRETAISVAERVQKTSKDYQFEPMNPRDRRVIHLAIRPMKGLETFTVGEGSHRRVIVSRVNPDEEQIREN